MWAFFNGRLPMRSLKTKSSIWNFVPTKFIQYEVVIIKIVNFIHSLFWRKKSLFFLFLSNFVSKNQRWRRLRKLHYALNASVTRGVNVRWGRGPSRMRTGLASRIPVVRPSTARRHRAQLRDARSLYKEHLCIIKNLWCID